MTRMTSISRSEGYTERVDSRGLRYVLIVDGEAVAGGSTPALCLRCASEGGHRAVRANVTEVR